MQIRTLCAGDRKRKLLLGGNFESNVSEWVLSASSSNILVYRKIYENFEKKTKKTSNPLPPPIHFLDSPNHVIFAVDFALLTT